jgi:putative ABC transport system substrate-binding protein
MKTFGVKISLILVLSFILLLGCTKESVDKKGFVIGINQFMQHPLLDDVRKGLVEELNGHGISTEKGSTFLLKNANGDQNVAVQINKQFVDRKVDIIVPLGTPSAQSAVKLTKTIPIVFGAITDPVSAGLADSIKKPGGNKTGTSDRWPYKKQVGLMKKLVPNAKKVGIILNPGEANTQASMEFIRPALKELGLAEIDVPVSSTSEVYGAAQSLVGRCDVILVPADNTVVSAFESVVKVANENKIPLFAGSIDSVKKGAVATYGVNYYEIGRATGQLVAQILKGELDPGTIPVIVESKADLVININAAKAQGVRIPDEMLKNATHVDQEGN